MAPRHRPTGTAVASMALGCVLVMLARGPSAPNGGDGTQMGLQGPRRRTLGTDKAASMDDPHGQAVAAASAAQSSVGEEASSGGSSEVDTQWNYFRGTSSPPPRDPIRQVDPFAPDECWDIVSASSVHAQGQQHDDEQWKDPGYPSDYELFPSDYENDQAQEADELEMGSVEAERSWGVARRRSSRRRRRSRSPPPPLAYHGYPRAPPWGAPQSPDWNAQYGWPSAPPFGLPPSNMWPKAPPFNGWPAAPPWGSPVEWQAPEWREYHQGWPKAPPYGAPNAPPFRGWPQAPPYGMPAEWQAPDWSRTHVGWPPAPPMHVWNGKCETVIKDQQVVYVQSSDMKAASGDVAKKAEKFLIDVDEMFDGGDKNGEDSSETSGYDFASSVGARTHETASASTPKIEISSSSRRMALYQLGMAIMSGVVALICVALVAAARRYISDAKRRPDELDSENISLLTYRNNKYQSQFSSHYGSTTHTPANEAA